MEDANVPEFVWSPTSALKTILPASSPLRSLEQAVRIAEIPVISLVHVMARRGKWRETARVAQGLWGVEPPAKPSAAFGGTATLVWSGPDQFFALEVNPAQVRDHGEIVRTFAGIASVSEQSDGRCLVELSGARTREALARLCSIDLDEAVFPVGGAAATSIDHTTVQLWRDPDGPEGHPAFRILMFASFAGSIARTIQEATAGFAH
jgi:methylglutamate dehydrogenase subunit D